MRLTIFILIFVSASILELAGQERALNPELILIHGVVMDAESEMPVVNAHYFVNKIHGGISDTEGKFSLYVYRGDTITFSYLGYSDVHCLTDTLAGNSFVAGIFMHSDTLSIGEVLVFPRMGDLRTEFNTSSTGVSQEIVNAQNNLMISTYQGLNNQATLGDPETNYSLLKQKQTIEAYERGGIPSDKMVNLNFISLIPASIYLLSNGLPERPPPPKPRVSNSDIEKMKKAYREAINQK